MFQRSILVIGLSLIGAFANNSAIQPEAFTSQEPLLVTQRIPLIPEFGDRVLASKPEALESGYLYMRKKNNATTYSWYKAKPIPGAFESLKAFRPATSKVSEFISVKLYGTRNAKAFQDESEIYFDQNYIYSNRVPTLFYIQDDQWLEMNAQQVELGSLEVNSSVPCSVSIDGKTMGMTPAQLMGLPAGIHTIRLWAPGYLSTTSGVMVVKGQVTRKGIQLTALDSSVRFVQPYVVAMDTLLDAVQLEALEPHWDRLQANDAKYQDFLVTQRKAFESKYPPLIPAPLSVPIGDVGYQFYKDTYQQTRDEAYGQYLSAILAGGKELEELLKFANARKDSLESLTIQERVLLDAQRTESGILILKLRDPKGRIDVSWKSSTADSSAWLTDSIKTALQDTMGWCYLQVKLENKPVKLTETIGAFRRHYRYLSLSLVEPNGVRELSGQFILPDYMMLFQEVQDWLKARNPKAVEVPQVETAAQDVIPSMPEIKKPAPVQENRELWMGLYRGPVAEIQGGTFRYKSKMVLISPFAIHSTEVTQEHFQRISLKNPAKKFIAAKLPVHSVTWGDARRFCQEIGGDLPTEAQWEFAARAGIQGGLLWKETTETTQVSDFAVYQANSEKLKGKEGYGPHAVGSLRPNAFGLYDVSGNVAEWTRDKDSWFHFYVDSKDPEGAWMGADRVFKGGSWQSPVDELDLKEKDYEDPRYWGTKLGFRCAFPAMQVLSLDSVKTTLMQKDSLAMSMGLTLMGGSLKQIIGNPSAEPTSSAKGGIRN